MAAAVAAERQLFLRTSHSPALRQHIRLALKELAELAATALVAVLLGSGLTVGPLCPLEYPTLPALRVFTQTQEKAQQPAALLRVAHIIRLHMAVAAEIHHPPVGVAVAAARLEAP